jgi:transcriptional regulator with XRE-family HTH domain
MFPNLIAEMARKGITQTDICKCINKNKSTVSEKMNGKREFKISEIIKIKDTFFSELTLEYLFEKK